jgi:hypothetical protein
MTNGRGWFMKKAEKELWVQWMMERFQIAGIEEIAEYELTLSHNTRMDVDNTIMLVKYFNDALQDGGHTKGDSKEYWKHLHMFSNSELPKGEVEIIINYQEVTYED